MKQASIWVAACILLIIGASAFGQEAISSQVKRITVSKPAPASSASQEGKDAGEQAGTPQAPSSGFGKIGDRRLDDDCLKKRLRGERLDEDCKKKDALLMGRSPGAGSTDQSSTARDAQAGKAQAMAEAEAHIRTNYAAGYDGYEGEFVFEAKGDKGGFAKLNLKFDGFYLRPVLTLSQSLQGQIPPSPDYRDRYQIIPKNVNASFSMSTTRKCIYPGLSEIFGQFTVNLAETYSNPAPPNYESMDLSIPKWIDQARSGFLGEKLRFSFVVESLQPAGGDAWLSIDVYAMAPGVLQRRNSQIERVGRMMFFMGDGQDQAHISVNSGSLSWRLPERAKLNENFSLADISLDYSGSASTTDEHCPASYRQDSDRQWQLNYRFNVRAKQTFEAILTAEDEDSGTYKPKPNHVRTFKLTLKDLKPEQVQAVRFRLVDVSQHPGVATNAGNHLLYGQCQDCSINKEPSITYVSKTFPHEDGRDYPIRRACVHYNSCTIDQLPDLFFGERENSGWDLSQGGTKEKLQYTISQVAKRKEIDGAEVKVKVTVKDGAALGKLKAEVQVAGVWHAARAEGPSADDSGRYLMLPVDKNGNGMADAWEKIFQVSDPDQDDESLPKNPHRGDGLTVFEEYRGIYWRDGHVRLSPKQKDVFVYDYSRMFGDSLGSLFHLFSAQDIHLWPIRSDEHKEEMVNYHQGSRHKQGDQYVIVTMALSQCPGIDFGRAGGKAFRSPPTAECNTVVIKDPVVGELAKAFSASASVADILPLTGTLGHEIGHNMCIAHHGEGDDYRVVKGEDVMIALPHGLHSGQKDCFMKYNSAKYFVDMDFIPESSITLLLALRPFDQKAESGQQNYFCKDKKGSGVCGDAREGNCLGQLRVKSY